MSKEQILGLCLLSILVIFFIVWNVINLVKYYHFQKVMAIGMPCKVKEDPLFLLTWPVVIVYYRKIYIGKIEGIHGVMWVQVRFIKPSKTPDGYTVRPYFKKYVYPR